MMFSTPFHKQTDPAKQAGQIINRPEPPSNHDMMDDMAEHVSAKEYKTVHGGRPDFEVIKKHHDFELRIVGSQEGGRK